MPMTTARSWGFGSTELDFAKAIEALKAPTQADNTKHVSLA